MNRLIGIVLAGVWILAMAALVQRDVLPFWTAQEAPAQLMPLGDYQIGIYNQAGARLGTTWINATPSPQMLVRSTTVLDTSKIAGPLPAAGNWVIQSDLSYDSSGSLETFKFTLSGSSVILDVSAARIERDFSVIARLGEMKQSMLLDGDLSRYLSETLRPFTHLEGLSVGQRWRIRLLDPFSIVKDQSVEFQTELAQVSRMETIDHHGRPVDCYRVETPSATAWADLTGRVLKQEVRIPLLGRWTLVDEPYDRTNRPRTGQTRKRS